MRLVFDKLTNAREKIRGGILEEAFACDEVAPPMPAELTLLCAYGNHWLPATTEYFARAKNSPGRYYCASYCRSCTRQYCATRKHALRAQRNGTSPSAYSQKG